ncbi:MAG: hypothetical protein KQA35_04455 [Candidatus Aenigmarchaeota archaeon]|nr:hypothetical protein [Candidatus Aenigmarchaeota archaeon]
MSILEVLFSGRSTLATIVIISMLLIAFGQVSNIQKLVDFFTPLLYIFGFAFLAFLALSIARNIAAF